jgi:CRP/FNR family transcriptional regulator
MIKLLDTISRVPSFSGLPESQLKEIKDIAVERHYNKGEIIFSDGDEGDGFFVVVEGLVKIFKASLDGKEQILHIYGPGEPFGQVAVEHVSGPFKETPRVYRSGREPFLKRGPGSFSRISNLPCR